jgi:hypothetical protein
MAAVRCNRNEPRRSSISDASLNVLVPGDDVRVVWIVADAALWLVYSSTLRDGGALPTDRIPISANERYPAVVGGGKRILVQAQTGSANVAFVGAYE